MSLTPDIQRQVQDALAQAAKVLGGNRDLFGNAAPSYAKEIEALHDQAADMEAQARLLREEAARLRTNKYSSPAQQSGATVIPLGGGNTAIVIAVGQ